MIRNRIIFHGSDMLSLEQYSFKPINYKCIATLIFVEHILSHITCNAPIKLEILWGRFDRSNLSCNPEDPGTCGICSI